MLERENNTGIEKEKSSKKKIVMAIVTVMILSFAVFGIAKVYNSPAKQLEKQLNLGNRYLEEMNYEQAIVAFDKAIEIDPQNTDAYLGKAEAYIGLDNSDMAIETLETGYQATEEAETIKSRLLDIYVEMVEDAIEKGSYEEGKKTYERIVELGGEDKELRKKLEELQNDGSEEEDIAQTEGQEDEELPYYELGFSPEDFTLAGYSVMDGNHLDDIVQAAAAIMPEFGKCRDNYTGWYWEKDGGSLLICYMYKGAIFIDGDGIPIGYSANSKNGFCSFGIGGSSMGSDYALYEKNNWPIDAISEFPLFKGKVVPYIFSYEDTIDTLAIREVIQQMKENGQEQFVFESQYGIVKCEDYSWDGEEWYQFEMEDWRLDIEFVDNRLESIGVGGFEQGNKNLQEE